MFNAVAIKKALQGMLDDIKTMKQDEGHNVGWLYQGKGVKDPFPAKITCFIYNSNFDVVSYGVALRHPRDSYNPKIGRYLSFRRAVTAGFVRRPQYFKDTRVLRAQRCLTGNIFTEAVPPIEVMSAVTRIRKASGNPLFKEAPYAG